VSRDDDIAAILERGRQTRKPTPRWLWIAALVIGSVCTTGFAAAMLAAREPAIARPAWRPERAPASGPGLGIGLAIGAAAGLVIGFSIGRQRRDHSSRNNP
jgi:hypothetical protein